MSDAIFIISNALACPPNLSIYNVDERFNQTLQTIDSIDKYCPSNAKVMFDASPTEPDRVYFDRLTSRDVSILHTGAYESIQYLSNHGAKSPAEATSFLIALNWIKENNLRAKRIYKISGRYRLNENFVPGYEHIGKYVFTVPTKTWMSQDRIDQTGVDHVYQSRLFHFDYDLLDQVIETLPEVIQDCFILGIDIEHAYYKHFKNYEPIEMKKIGLCGNLAPTGEYIDE